MSPTGRVSPVGVGNIPALVRGKAPQAPGAASSAVCHRFGQDRHGDLTRGSRDDVRSHGAVDTGPSPSPASTRTSPCSATSTCESHHSGRPPPSFLSHPSPEAPEGNPDQGGGGELRSALRADPRSARGSPGGIFESDRARSARTSLSVFASRIPAGSPPRNTKRARGQWPRAQRVEAAGVEPASAKGFGRVATCVDRYWISLRWVSGQPSWSQLPWFSPHHPEALRWGQPELSSPQEPPRASNSRDGPDWLRGQCQISVGNYKVSRVFTRFGTSTRYSTFTKHVETVTPPQVRMSINTSIPTL